MAVLGPHCCGQAFSNWEERGLLSGCRVQASHCGGFFCGAWALERGLPLGFSNYGGQVLLPCTM